MESILIRVHSCPFVDCYFSLSKTGLPGSVKKKTSSFAGSA